MDPDQTTQGPHCLPVCKNRFEKFARIFSRRHKQTTFSGAVFLGALRVKSLHKCVTNLARRQCAMIALKAMSCNGNIRSRPSKRAIPSKRADIK